MFKFGQIEVESKDFYKQRHITDILTISINKVVLSAKVPCSNGKDWWYVVAYQIDGKKLYLCLSRRPKTYLAMACHNTTRTPPTQCHLMFLRHLSECFSL